MMTPTSGGGGAIDGDVSLPAVRTRLTDLLGIEHPVMCAGMGGVSYHRLVAAVSGAGGFGCLGASTMTSDEMVAEIRAVRASTDRPFGVDLLTALPDRLMADVETLIREGASVFVAGLGVPRDAIALCHDHGVLVASMCGKVRHAIAAVEAGCDLVIAQGTEAGGHTGLVATMPLVPQVVDAVAGRVPVVAAGGIVDGRGLAAALVLGADGVWVGTRFIATPEARAAPGYKDALARTAEDGTVVTRAYSGKPMRTVANEWTRHHEAHPEEVRPFPEQLGVAMRAGALHLGADETATGVDPERECYPAGQGVGAIDGLVPAADLVRRFVEEAEAALTRAAAR
jgi:enoyl-[acyl-carrier protein] reductase II